VSLSGSGFKQLSGSFWVPCLFSSITLPHDDKPSQWYACCAMLSNKNRQVWLTTHQIAGYNFSSQMVQLLTQEKSVARPSLGYVPTVPLIFLSCVLFILNYMMRYRLFLLKLRLWQNKIWSDRSRSFTFSLASLPSTESFGICWHGNGSRAGHFRQAQHFRYSASGRLHFPYSPGTS
jgi:hypothetical protein